MLNIFASKKQKAEIFSIPQNVITEKGILSIDRLKKGNKIIGDNGVINTVEKVEKHIKKGYFYVVNKKLVVYQDQSVMINGNAMHAFELKRNEELTMRDGTKEKIATIKKIKGNYYFHKLTVSGDHTYYINEVLVHNASRYWVGGTNTWNTTNGSKWSTTSGGGGGSARPTSSDTAFFDSASGSGTITLGNDGNVCDSFTMTGFTGTVAGSNELGVYGNLTYASGMTLTYSGIMRFYATATGKTITTNGKTITNAFYFQSSSGGWTLQDALTSTANISIYNLQGTFDTGNYNMTLNAMGITNIGGTTVMNLGSSLITMTGDNSSTALTRVWDCATSGSITMNAGTSVIKFTNSSSNSADFYGGSKTYYDIWNATDRPAGFSQMYIKNNNTFHDLKISTPTGTKVYTQFDDGGTTTITGDIIGVGTSGHILWITTLNGTSAHTLSKSSGTVSCDYMNISYSTASGGASFYAGANSTNGGNNSGWSFTAPATNITVNPSAQSATFSLPSATVSGGAIISPSVKTATFSIPAYTITAQIYVTVSPAVKSATFSLPAPTVTGGATVSSNVFSATFSIPSYSIITPDAYVSPSVQTATFSIPAYDVEAQTFVTVNPSVVSATFSIPAHSEVGDVDISASVVSAVFSIPSYVAGIGISITPSAQSCAFSIPSYTTTATKTATILPSIQTLTFTTPDPSIIATRFVIIDMIPAQASFTIPKFTIVADFWQDTVDYHPNTSWSDKDSVPSTSWNDKY